MAVIMTTAKVAIPELKKRARRIKIISVVYNRYGEVQDIHALTTYAQLLEILKAYGFKPTRSFREKLFERLKKGETVRHISKGMVQHSHEQAGPAKSEERQEKMDAEIQQAIKSEANHLIIKQHSV
jgi:hypothetical protein